MWKRTRQHKGHIRKPVIGDGTFGCLHIHARRAQLFDEMARLRQRQKMHHTLCHHIAEAVDGGNFLHRCGQQRVHIVKTTDKQLGGFFAHMANPQSIDHAVQIGAFGPFQRLQQIIRRLVAQALQPGNILFFQTI